MGDMSWEALRTMAAMISAFCALIAAGVSVAVWRKARSSDLGKKIEDGDKSVRSFAEAHLAQLRESVDEVSETVTRVEALQKAEAQHMVRHTDLTIIHEKINRVAEDTAGVRAEQRANNSAVREQLNIITRHILKQGG